MKKLLILTIILLPFLEVHGQDFAPIGSKWHYTILQSFFNADQGYESIECIGDTIIQDRNCRVLEKIAFWSNGDFSHQGFEYIHVNGDTISRFSEDGNFYVLYNFSAEVGDKWISKTYDGTFGEDVAYEVTVVNKSSVQINGQILTTMQYETDSDYLSYDGDIIEFLGASSYMFPFNYVFLDGGIRRGLRCYSDDDFGEYITDATVDCDALIVSLDVIEIEDGYKISPNPTSHYFSIGNINNELDLEAVSIYSAHGELVERRIFNNLSGNVDFEIYNKGMYIIEFISKRGRIVKKLIVN